MNVYVGFILLAVVFLATGIASVSLARKDREPFWYAPAVFAFSMAICLGMVGVLPAVCSAC